MRHKKLLAAALALVMALALAAPAFADPPTGSITIQLPTGSAVNSILGETFYVYRIFDATANAGYSSWAYTTASKFDGFTYTYPNPYGMIYDKNMLPGYIAGLDADKDGDADDPALLTAFATAAWAWISNGNDYDPDTWLKEDGKTTVTAMDDGSNTIDGLPLGYYLVYGTGVVDVDTGETVNKGNQQVVAACALTTTNPDQVIKIKADAPTITKTVSDKIDGIYGDYADIAIGDRAYFKLTTTVPNMEGYSSYNTFIVTDTLSSRFTADVQSFKFKLDGVDLLYNGDYSFGSHWDSATGTTTFTIHFQNFYTRHKNDVGKTIEITYSAMLKANAVIGPNGNPNKVKLQYSNDPYHSNGTSVTPEDEVLVYTFRFDVLKYTGDIENSPTGLPDAEFELRTDAADEDTAISFASPSLGSYRPVLPTDASDAITTTLVSDSYGKIWIYGLDVEATDSSDIYYLVETKAPDGYNKLTKAIQVRIVPDYSDTTGALTGYEVKISDDGTSWTTATGMTINVENNGGIEFPESGGIGRTIFTLVGLLLMLGAGVVLIARRKTATGR